MGQRAPVKTPCKKSGYWTVGTRKARFRCGSAPSPVRGESRKRNCGQRGPRGCDATKAKKDLQYYPHLFPSTYVKGTRAYACYAGTGHPGPSAIAIGPMSYRWTSQSFVSSICLLDPAAVRWIVTGLAIRRPRHTPNRVETLCSSRAQRGQGVGGRIAHKKMSNA
ncbi:hypothetical protein K432DRAFT_446844 [Lepidopterella palustris CBS 459.81]|uniref:Uncharacterized protein n=1 Tax=Lepidopterella palustris CBS 459.81 TaxID=1314670 RepID=A0A8E2E0U0_9PEZI|nr:hypothetical protein K432DRAFT_446844 [Lepidopterella palustris CBS 459.81]